MRAPLWMVLLAALTVEAGAHEWYSSTTDPVTRGGCCGGSDCNVLPDGSVTEVQGGYRVELTLDQAKAINPKAESGIGAFVPRERFQPSPDSKFHACIWGKNRDAPHYGVICFYGPVNS